MAALAVHERCVRHPAFCSPAICRDMGGDIAHQETPEVFSNHPDEILTVGLDQWDELEVDGRQVVYDADVVVGVTCPSGMSEVHLSPDTADALAVLLHETARRARTREGRP